MDKKYAPVLPFDGTEADNFEVYDKMTYNCKIDLYQSESPIKLHHSSMVKYYSCKYENKPVRLGGG